MTPFTGPTLVLLLGAVLLLVGLAGLAPSGLQLLRRKRLLAQLANLKVDEDAARHLFGEGIAPHDQEDTGPAVTAIEPTILTRRVAPGSAASPPVPALLVVAGAAAAPVEASPVEGPNASLPDQDQALDEDGVAGAEEEQEDAASETEAPADDFMALFKETKVTSSTPAALADAYDNVSVGDLLAQARELREMLRRAA